MLLALFVVTLARAADAPPVWDWSEPRRYRLSVNEVLSPAIQVGLADNIMASLTSYAVTLAVTCAASGESAGAGGTTVACKVDSATLSGGAGNPSDQAKLDESLRQLESWVRGSSVDFVQKSDGEIKRVGEVAPGPDAERMSRYRTAWLNGALAGCLGALDVVVSLDADEWRTPLPHGGSLKLRVTERTDAAVTFEGEHGEIARISVQFDREARAITRSRIYYAALGNTSTAYWHQEHTSELLEAK
jgi:hypothetical protein